MTRFHEPVRARLGHLVHRWRGFRGNVDGFVDNAVVGWVAPLDIRKGALRIGIYSQRGLVAEATANMHRGDLEAAGIGSGYHGFHVPLDEIHRRSILEAGGEITVRVLGTGGGRLGKLQVPRGAGAANGVRPRSRNGGGDLGHLLEGDFARLKALADEIAQSGSAPFVPPKLARHSVLFDSVDRVRGGALPPPMYAYADYARYRYKVDAVFDIREGLKTVANFLHWELCHYATLRGGLRIPMSREMIEFFNEPLLVPGQRTQLSRATWAFLPSVPQILSVMNFENEDWVNWAVYWWAVVQAKALHVEDCLVPESYVQRLANVPERFARKAYAPSEFMVRLTNESEALSRLDLERERDRRVLGLASLTMAYNRPDFLRYIPRQIRDDLLAPDGEDETNNPFSAFLAKQQGRNAPKVSYSDHVRMMRLRGVDAATGRFQTFTSQGDRVESARLSAPAGAAVDVQVIGPFEKASGLGQATRLSAMALRETGIELNLVDFDLDNPAPEGFSSRVAHAGYRPARINILHLNGESVPLAYAYQPDVFSDAYNIGYFFWELDSPAACHELALDLLDEIWVSTEFGVSIYQPHTDKPVRNVGMCVEPAPEINEGEARSFVARKLDIGNDVFVFLAVFDSFSFVQRKNPIGTLRAFLSAFPDERDVRLMIKTQNRSKVADPTQIAIWKQVDEIIAADPRIELIDETLPYADLLKLKKGADCYVSLHRSEGWGFGMIEAMNLGVPVICTAYSGNLDFCSDDTAWLVDYELIELEPNDYIFVRPGQRWAEPDVDDAARQMREVRAGPERAAKKAENALRNVRENFSAQAIATRYQARLDEILKSREAES